MGKIRRRWSDDEKRSIVEECAKPGAVVARVAREYGASSSQIYGWRKRFGPQELDSRDEEPVFLPVAVEGRDDTGTVDAEVGVTIRFANGHEMDFPVSTNASDLKRLLQVMAAL